MQLAAVLDEHSHVIIFPGVCAPGTVRDLHAYAEGAHSISQDIARGVDAQGAGPDTHGSIDIEVAAIKAGNALSHSIDDGDREIRFFSFSIHLCDPGNDDVAGTNRMGLAGEGQDIFRHIQTTGKNPFNPRPGANVLGSSLHSHRRKQASDRQDAPDDHTIA